ncbi:hypothetical protein A5732_16780 [Mycobacterium colombiense]|nr:hypothetical protein A5732_16780 [Mycobacterium colombiense]
MTAQQLAERCRELQVPIHRTTITKIEGGRGRFDLGELLILAAALDVPPIVLLYPDLPDGDIEIIPDRPATSWTAYLWATGMAPSFLNAGERSNGYRLVQAVSERHELGMERGKLQVRIGLYPPDGDPAVRESMENRVSAINVRIGQLDSEIRELRGVLKDA